MRNYSLLFFTLTSQATAAEWKIEKRDVTITSTVYTTTYVCPCTTYTAPPSISSSLSISFLTNSASIGSPVLTSATGSSMSSATTVPIASASSTTTSVATASSFTSSAPGAGSTNFISAASLGDYRTTVLSTHNLHRRNHSAADLTWSDTMARYAAQIASTCVYAHSQAAGDGNYGQNIGAGFTPGQIAFMITNAMYDGEMTKFPGPYGSDNVDTSNFGAWGHFSQIVWADTTQVGCATQYCPNGLQGAGSNVPPYFTVCNYFPPGNFVGQWSKVHAPLGNPSVIIVD